MTGGLANHVWQSTLFALMAGAVAVALRKNQARVRYWIWFAASTKFLVPFAALIGLGSAAEWAPTVQHFTTPTLSVAVVQVSQPFLFASPLPVPAASATSDRLSWLAVALVGTWACGAAAVTFGRFRMWKEAQHVARAGHIGTVSGLSTPLSVPVRIVPGLMEPAVFGFFRPVLLLPAGIETYLPAPQLDAIVMHELCHIRRRDNLTASVQMVVEAVFWFHPIVWWIGSRLVAERERACDEHVLQATGEPRAYAEAIVNVCKRFRSAPVVCVSGVSGANLSARVEAIMMNRVGLHLNVIRRFALVAAGAVTFGAPVIVGAIGGPVQARSSPTTRARADVPDWEAVSVRPCRSAGGRGGGRGARGDNLPQLSPRRMVLPCHTVAALVASAYVLHADGQQQPMWAMGESGTAIEGGPDWVRSDGFTVNALADGNPAYAMMQGPMLQKILEDRFGLKTRHEVRQVPVFHLTVASRGAKLQPFKKGSCVTLNPVSEELGPPRIPEGQRYCENFVTPKLPNFEMQAEGATIEEFTNLFLSGTPFVGRRVIDKTGIVGRFNIRVEFAPLRPDGDSVLSPDTAGASIFTALQEQLGLKLEPARGPAEVLVIEGVERPTEN
jgi:uncharacterized protein (TIGR03435 family)